MHAPPKPSDIPYADLNTLTEYDGILFGFSTRFGTYAAQFKAFWDASGGLWASGAFHGKYVGLFLSTGTMGGGQETLARNTISSFVHHGMIYVPLGYKDAFGELANLEEVHGGSPWGAGTFAGADGSRLPSELEKKVAFTQGKSFAGVVLRATSGAANAAAAETATPAAAPVAAPVAAAAATEPAAAPAVEKKAAAPAPRANQQAAPAKKPAEEKKKFGCCIIM